MRSVLGLGYRMGASFGRKIFSCAETVTPSEVRPGPVQLNFSRFGLFRENRLHLQSGNAEEQLLSFEIENKIITKLLRLDC